MRRIFPTSLILILLVASTVVFQNCSGGMKSAVRGGVMTAESPSVIDNGGEVPQLNCVPKPISKLTDEEDTISLDAFPGGNERIAGELIAAGGTDGAEALVAVFINECLREKGARSFLSQLAIQTGLKPQDGKVAYEIKTGQAKSVDELSQAFSDDPCIHSLDKQAIYKLNAEVGVPTDVGYSKEKHLSYIKHSTAYVAALNSANGINRDVRIAIIDSGVDVYHPDLADSILRSSTGALVAYNGTDGSSNVTDAGFHGTHVAGLAAATAHNNIGISGVLGKHGKIIPVKVAVDGSTNILSPTLSLDALVNGIRWSADQGAEVINLSLGGNGSGAARPTLKEAVQYAASKGALVVMAAGNDGKVLDSTFSQYPAIWGAEIDGAIAVGSQDATTGVISTFSNRSPAFVDIMAPGSDGTTGIYSSVPTALVSTGTPYASGINVKDSTGATSRRPINGTSMASPVAAGSAAMMIGLLKSRGLTPTPRQVERLFLLGAVKTGSQTAFAKDGNVLDLDALIARIDKDTGISSKSTQARTALKGKIVFSEQPKSTGKIYGETVEFKTDLSDEGSVVAKYQWYKNGIAINGANREVLRIENLVPADKAVYSVKASLGTTSVESQKATLQLAATYCN